MKFKTTKLDTTYDIRSLIHHSLICNQRLPSTYLCYVCI